MNENIEVRHALVSDMHAIRTFLLQEWPYVSNEEYFKYLYKQDSMLNFVLGIGEKTSKIYGICGYILTNINKSVIQLVTLKINKNKNGLSSIQLLEFINTNFKDAIICSCGIRPKTKIIYEYLGYHTGKMDHFYLLNKKSTYKVAEISKVPDQSYHINKEYSLKLLNKLTDIEEYFKNRNKQKAQYYKDLWCIEHRYFNNPWRKYKVYAIVRNHRNDFQSILVIREIVKNGVKICKIIDFIGLEQEIGELGYALNQLMEEEQYEYIDIYSAGISKEVYKSSGFTEVTKEHENIIPHYFEPFEKRNIEIYYFTSKLEQFSIFRGDGDMDRVNSFE